MDQSGDPFRIDIDQYIDRRYNINDINTEQYNIEMIIDQSRWRSFSYRYRYQCIDRQYNMNTITR